MSAAIRILVCDDHPVVRDGLVAMLATQPDFVVVAEAGDGAEALRRAADACPDVALLDLAMPGLDGVETLVRLREVCAGTRAIVFTAFDTDERILAAVRAGAAGYVLKGAPREELFRAIRVVATGGSLLEPVVAAKLLRALGPDRAGQPELTAREHEVLRLLARGQHNKEIAATLGITSRTVKFHSAAIYRKLGAGNRTEAVALATERGLLRQRGS